MLESGYPYDIVHNCHSLNLFYKKLTNKNRALVFRLHILHDSATSKNPSQTNIQALLLNPVSPVPTQGQEEGVLLWARLGPLGSGGALQERDAHPEHQGDPENQEQQAEKIGLFP